MTGAIFIIFDKGAASERSRERRPKKKIVSGMPTGAINGDSLHESRISARAGPGPDRRP
jgi:hypothetical protein